MNIAISQKTIAFSQYDGEHRATRSRLTLASTSAAEEECRAGAAHLTPRQLEVLALLCEGLPNKLICRRLNISAGTVKAHISSILRELGVASRLQAVVAARRHALVEEPLAHNGHGGHNGNSAAGTLDFSGRAMPRQFGHRHP